jgi:hypothetical protein
VHRKRSGVRKQVQQAASRRARGDRRPTEPHVREQTDAERRGDVDAEAAPAILDDELERRLLAARAHRGLGRSATGQRPHAPLLVEATRQLASIA